MKYNITKNWLANLELMTKRPVVILPFIFIAFFESLALELIYFFPRKPLSIIVGPIIRKFFGETFSHYPANFILLPKLFYYAQVVIYIFLGVFLTAITVNIFKNVKAGLPLKAKALIKNALSQYLSFFIFGVIVIILLIGMQRAEGFLFSKGMNVLSKYLPQVILKMAPLWISLIMFLSNVIMQSFLILTVPIIVIKKRPLFKALINSIYLGFRNFFTIFTLIFLPFLLYLPIVLLKGFSTQLIDKTFPEMNLLITGAGIIVAIFADCIMMLSASQFLLDKEEAG